MDRYEVGVQADLVKVQTMTRNTSHLEIQAVEKHVSELSKLVLWVLIMIIS